MFKAVFASLRIAFALVCVGLSLLLGAQWFGLIPDRTLYEIQNRRHWAQTAVASVQNNLQDRQFMRLRRQLRHLAASEPTVASIGLRDRTGFLVAATVEHDELWSRLTSKKAGPPHDGRESSLANGATGGPAGAVDLTESALGGALLPTSVPIVLGQRVWGDMEVAFVPPASRLLGGTLDRGIAPLLIFFGVGGMIGYAGLMIRLMNVFRKTQVVPERVRGALDTLTEGVLVLDDAGKILLANESFAASIGSPPGELVGADACLLRWVPLEEAPPGGESLDSNQTQDVAPPPLAAPPNPAAAERRGGLPIEAFPWMQTLRERHAIVEQRLDLIDTEGRRRNYAINAAPLGDGREQKGALVTFADITHREQSRRAQEATMQQLRERESDIQQKNRELEILATRDALTGCLNRRAFFDRTERLLADHRIERRPLSCVMVDIDHFKNVNDTFGHHTGDEVIRAVSGVLRSLHEPDHLVCRYGGEEFCVVFPGVDTQTAVGKAEETRHAIAAIRLEEPASLRLTASLGVSSLAYDPADTQELINQADECLYVAKRGGRNRVVGYDPGRAATPASETARDDASQPDNGPAAAGANCSGRGPRAGAASESVAPTSNVAKPPAAATPIRLPMDLISPLVAAMTLREPRLGTRARVHADRCLRVAEGRLEPSVAYRLEIAALLSEFGLIGASETSLRRWLDDPESAPRVVDRGEVDGPILKAYHDGQIMVAETFDCPVLRQILLHDVDPALLSESQRESTRLASEILRLAAVDQVPRWARPVSERSAPPIRPQTRAFCHLAGWTRAGQSPPASDPSIPADFANQLDQLRSSPRGAEVTTGIALALHHQIAGQLRGAVADLSEAMGGCQRGQAADVVGRVEEIAQTYGLHPIVRAADAARCSLRDEQTGWEAVSEQLRELTQLCRKTDNAHLVRQSE